MLNVLIVEHDAAAGSALAAMLEPHEEFCVVGFASDLESSVAIARTSNVHIAFVAVDLAEMETGYQVADTLNRLGIICVLVTTSAAPFAMPELAAAWLEEPNSTAAVSEALRLASENLFAKPELKLQ